ncbi:hypothetical protein [Halorubrum sp. DTA46]|uniref:hypothetical protein n=1 Tax=Halorubrum sp. DTA46 TaxID=3402162 RepID=UPI003AACFB9C
MSSSDHDSNDDEIPPEDVLFYMCLGIYVCILGYVQLALGINTTSANVVTGLLIILPIALIVAIRLRGDIPAEWFGAVFVMKPVALIQQKFGSWKLNWRARNQNPYQQTPFVTLLNALHLMKNRLAKLISQIAARISKRIASNTATAESTPTDDTATETTDDDTETTNE